jgi:RNA polymerase sigma factor (sigma-70 family)
MRPVDGGSDEQLWTRARAGDSAAFAAVFDRHVNAVYSHCLRRAGSWSDADDLTSMTFFTVWRKAGRARFIDGSLRPWLLAVATNLARTQFRARRRYEAMLARLPQEELGADSADEILASLEAEQRAEQLAAAISKLSKADQLVLSLCDLGELTYEQTAAVLGIPIGTVRSRLSRARARLRRAMGPDPTNSTFGARVAGASTPGRGLS